MQRRARREALDCPDELQWTQQVVQPGAQIRNATAQARSCSAQRKEKGVSRQGRKKKGELDHQWKQRNEETSVMTHTWLHLGLGLGALDNLGDCWGQEKVVVRSCCLISDPRSAADGKRKFQLVRPVIHAWLQPRGTRLIKRGIVAGIGVVLQYHEQTSSKLLKSSPFASNHRSNGMS
jgi:hypothetical protein